MLLFQAVEEAGQTVNALAGDWSWLVIGIILVIAAILAFHFIKNMIVNTILGLLGWGVLTYVFHVDLPFWISLIVSAIFGLAGLGALLVLAFLGVTF